MNGSSPLTKLVLATHNAGKLVELQEILQPYIPKLYAIKDLGLPEPEETGDSFQSNALLKASLAARASNIPALADDSGIVIPALDGAPGIYSARWAGDKRDFNMAMQKVYHELQYRYQNPRLENFSAYFVCALAVAWPDGYNKIFEGQLNGTLTWPPRGKFGFGYDPIFVPTGYNKTMAELNPSVKNIISHRAQAFTQLKKNFLVL